MTDLEEAVNALPLTCSACPTQIIGEATVLNVYPRSSVVRIDASKDAIFLGDLAAIHRITQ